MATDPDSRLGFPVVTQPPVLPYVPQGSLPGNSLAPLAVGLSLLFLIATPFMTFGGLHAQLNPFTVPWFMLGMVFGGLLVRSIRQARAGRGGRGMNLAAIILLTLGGALGAMSVLSTEQFFGTDPHTRQRRVTGCQRQMTNVASAIYYFRDANEGRFPSKLNDLIGIEGTTAGTLAPPGNVTGGKGTPAPYIYLGAGLTNTAPPNTIILYEPLSNHSIDRKSIHVLTADYMVHEVMDAKADALLAKIATATKPIVVKDNELR